MPRKMVEPERDKLREIGARLRLARTRQKMSQRALGEKVGVAPQNLSCYERGVKQMGALLFVEVCRELDVSLRWLANGPRT